jgi:Uma2 family endonuclease
MTIATAPSTAVNTQNTQPILLDVTNTRLTVTSEQFDRLCLDNPNLRLELTPNRELIVMALTGGESGKKNARLSSRVVVWNDETDLGEVFDSSTGYDFTEFGGGKRSPDVSWIEKSRLEGKNIIGLIQIVPDFATELRSPTDNLSEARTKMAEYQQLGVRLGLFINPQDRQVEIYRPGQEVEILEDPKSIDCNQVMPGFILSMSKIL